MTIDRHTLALISIVGGALDMLGALYLAYDLLGGEHGPLRVLTRAVTYGVLFGSGYALALGPVGVSSWYAPKQRFHHVFNHFRGFRSYSILGFRGNEVEHGLSTY
jgi:hypothetical protein